MSNYNPDNWVVIKMNGDDPHYRVLAGWSGGYLDGDSWRMNSGIVRVEDAGDRFNFYGSTGSCYSCGKESYCIRMNNAHIWAQLQELHGDKVKMLDEETDWLGMDWIIKLKIIEEYYCGQSEYGVAPMRTEDWNALGDWLDELKTEALLSYNELIEQFETHYGKKIRWADETKS